VLGHDSDERGRVGFRDPVEGHEARQRHTRRQGLSLPGDEVRIGTRRAPHGLAGVVDEDVQRSAGGDLVGERDDLGRIAQVDTDDRQPVKPLGRVGQGREAPRRIAGKRVVIVRSAPSRSSISAIYMPILARPPVSSARFPRRSVCWSRLP
jgi:hypothetical protein